MRLCSSLYRQTNGYYRHVWLCYEKSGICMFPSFLVYSGRNFTCELKNFSELFMQQFSFYTGNMHRQRKLRTSKNLYLPLLYKAHSYCNKKASRNLTRISRHFLETRGSPGKPGRLKDRERHETGDKDEKFCKWNTNFHWDVPTGKTGLPFE